MHLFSDNNVLSVSQITSQIKNILESKYRFVSIQGEISNLRVPFSGHSYFTLKDKNAQIRGVLFKGNVRYLEQPLQDGQQVICRGRLSVYEPRGEYQIIVDTVDHHGSGVLQAQFEALKASLSAEGLFAAEIKKQIPPFPSSITVISSATGAAIHDFLKICSNRATSATISVYPVAVQGEKAASEIANAIERVNREVKSDLIVLCRGGGSLEDLWAFNEELVARAIYNSAIPIVTGIGHETDHTIADFCADLRSPTPTGAAEAIIPDTAALISVISNQVRSMSRALYTKLNFSAERLRQQKRALKGYLGKVDHAALRVDAVTERLHYSLEQYFNQQANRISQFYLRLQNQAPLAKIKMKEQHLNHLRENLKRRMVDILKQQEEHLAGTAALLNSVSPLSTLARGYSIVQLESGSRGGKVVTDSAQVREGDEVNVRLHKGRLLCVVQSRVNNDKEDTD